MSPGAATGPISPPLPGVAAINRVNVQGTTNEQAEQIRAVMAVVFPEAVTLVREARAGLT